MPTFFVDRSLGRTTVVSRLREAGFEVIAHDDVLPQDTDDATWIRHAAERGWVILTKDGAIRRNPLERAAYREAGARVFILTSAGISGSEMASIFIAAMYRIEKRCAEIEPPFVFAVRRDGSMERLE